jgi:hypothetical protein
MKVVGVFVRFFVRRFRHIYGKIMGSLTALLQEVRSNWVNFYPKVNNKLYWIAPLFTFWFFLNG